MTPTWFQHPDLMQMAIVGLIAVIAWIFKRGMDRNIEVMDKIFNRLDDHGDRLSKLEGEHQARSCQYPRDGVPHEFTVLRMTSGVGHETDKLIGDPLYRQPERPAADNPGH